MRAARRSARLNRDERCRRDRAPMKGMTAMGEAEPGRNESAFDALLHGLDQGAISRGLAVRTLVVGGVVGRFVGAPRPAQARKRRLLKTLFAVVNAKDQTTPTLASAKGATSVERKSGMSTGGFRVRFNRNVDTCAYIATTANAFPGQASVETDSPNPDWVRVYITDSAGNLRDLDFHLIVIC